MAISVKQFLNPLNCNEPAYEIQVMYDSDVNNGAVNICNGGGTQTNIYGDFASLTDIYSNSATTNAGQGDICLEGMDVVFCVDYTGSMNGAIQGVKNGIAQIASEIATLTNNNYRLGLVTFDGGGQTTSSQYGSSPYYLALPADQRFTGTNPHGSGNLYITCQEKMSLNNIGDSTTGFTYNLSCISTPTNSANGMKLGSGLECGGQATYDISQGFAGQWRADVLKLIIVITDDKSEESASYFTNTVIPALDNQNIQVFHNTSQGPGYVNDIGRYKAAAENTTPAGLYVDNLTFSGTWTSSLITGIQDLCNFTTTYTCDPAAAGWYAETPVVGGTTTAYYWNGTTWTVQYACPAPQFTVQVDFVDSVSNGSVDDFPANLANQYDLDTLEFTGETGDVFSATASVTVDSGYQNMSLTVSNVSDTNIITSTSVDNGNLEVTIQVTIGSSDQTGANAESLQINGTASQIPRTLRVDVINSTTDTQDEEGATQTPSGLIDMNLVEPSVGSWTNMAGTYNNFAYRMDFIDTPGEIYNFDVEFIPSPSDYSLNVLSSIIQSTNLAGGGGNSFQPGLTAINNLTLATGSSSPDLTGTVTIPSVDCHVKIYITGDLVQPNYTYRFNASDTITGAFANPSLQNFIGYTGQLFPFTVAAAAESGYNNINVTSVIEDVNFNDNAAITTGPTVNGNNDGAEGTVTMPSGGGEGGIILGGSANQVSYTYTVTITDNMSTTSWNQVIFTGAAGSTPNAQNNVTALGNSEYSYNAQTISNNSSSGILTSTINSATDPSINLSLSAMPLGGGSATVTIGGTESQIQYNFSLNIVTDNPTTGSFVVPAVVLTGGANDVINGTFVFSPASGYEYLSTGHSTSSSAVDPIDYVTNQLLSTNYTVTMPSGGGSGTITCDDVEENAISYSYDLGFDTTESPTYSTNATITPSVPITLTGAAGTQVNWQYTVTPSPSYYELYNFVTSQFVTYSGNTNPGNQYGSTGGEISIGYTSGAGGNAKIIGGSVTMPSGGGSGSIMPTEKTEVINPDVTFTITVVNNIANTTFTPNSPIVLTAAAGDNLSQTIDVVADSGYSHDVTSAAVSNNYSGTISAAATIGDDVLFSGTMPVGGGSATVTINGTSSVTIAYANFNFTETAGGQAESEGDWDTATITVSGQPGTDHTISNSWRTTNNGQGNSFSAMSQSSITRTGTNYPAQDPFGGTFIRTQPTSGNVASMSGTFTMPTGGGTWGFEFTGTRFLATTTAAPCNCTNYETSNGGTPPVVALSNETNGGGNGHFDITWTTACGSIISSVDITVDYGSGYQIYTGLPSINNTTNKRWTGLSAGNYRATVTYDAPPCTGETDAIDIVIGNTTTTPAPSPSPSPNPRGPGFMSPGPGGQTP